MSEIFQSFGINFQAITDDPTDVGGRVRDSIVVEVGFPNIFFNTNGYFRSCVQKMGRLTEFSIGGKEKPSRAETNHPLVLFLTNELSCKKDRRSKSAVTSTLAKC